MLTSKDMGLIKYNLTALILKLCSVSPQSYRRLGNIVGNKKRLRTTLPDYYGDRINHFISLCKKYNVVKNKDNVIEIGTGWVHFESIILKMFYDIKATLFDVWDNRQFEALKKYFLQIEEHINNKMNLDNDQKDRIRQVINIIVKADSLDELYQSLSFRYVVNSSGTLDKFPNESFDLVYSCNVLEHVDSNTIARLIQDFHRILKPGGYSIHKIDLSDHLVSFGNIQNINKKPYLKYSDKTWKRYYENKVQYFNRIQYPEWLNLFQQAGLCFVEDQLHYCDLDKMNIDKSYTSIEKKYLQIESFMAIHRKPFQ